MSFRALLVVAVVGCGVPDDPLDLHLVGPDASVDAVDEVQDACVAEPSDGCCALLPDVHAVIACSTDGLPPEACGVVACRKDDCSFLKLNYCVPPALDAGLGDARSDG